MQGKVKVKKLGWMNVYRSGWFHRENKPTCFNRHAGDFYSTKECALADIEPASHYVDTVQVEWEEWEEIEVNPPDAVPVPLSVSRRASLRVGTGDEPAPLPVNEAGFHPSSTKPTEPGVYQTRFYLENKWSDEWTSPTGELRPFYSRWNGEYWSNELTSPSAFLRLPADDRGRQDKEWKEISHAA